MLYGLVMSSAPRFAPSNLNCTPATLTLSLADADTVTVLPDTAAPSDGAVIEMVGGVVSGALSARISQMNRLYRSPAGAVSLIVTLVADSGVGLVVRCTQ